MPGEDGVQPVHAGVRRLDAVVALAGPDQVFAAVQVQGGPGQPELFPGAGGRGGLPVERFDQDASLLQQPVAAVEPLASSP